MPQDSATADRRGDANSSTGDRSKGLWALLLCSTAMGRFRQRC